MLTYARFRFQRIVRRQHRNMRRGWQLTQRFFRFQLAGKGAQFVVIRRFAIGWWLLIVIMVLGVGLQVRWLINFLGLWTAASLLTGISYGNRTSVLIVAALIFSIVNALVRPLIIVLALPAILLTLGFFTLVVNAFMLYLVTLLYPAFRVDTFWQALLAVAIVWVVNYLLTDVMEHAA